MENNIQKYQNKLINLVENVLEIQKIMEQYENIVEGMADNIITTDLEKPAGQLKNDLGQLADFVKIERDQLQYIKELILSAIGTLETIDLFEKKQNINCFDFLRQYTNLEQKEKEVNK